MPSARRGSAVIEFAIVTFLLLFVILAGIELDRAVFVYTNLADATKAGIRYAITHGANRSTGGNAVDGPSGPGNTTQVDTLIKNYALALNKANLTVTVTYPDGDNNTGSRVKAVVQYTYDPWVRLPFPTGLQLSAVSEGIIAF